MKFNTNNNQLTVRLETGSPQDMIKQLTLLAKKRYNYLSDSAAKEYAINAYQQFIRSGQINR